MTLKEKFWALLPLYNVNNNKSIECEKIADYYAIEFAKWCNEYRIERIDYYQKTFEELLEIFKKEKGL
jgi:hypothetical protein